MRRRVASVANHLLPIPLAQNVFSSIGFSNCSSSSMNDNYHKIHGEVPNHEPVWRLIPSDDESGKDFTDIIYEKAVGEPIAKVFFLQFFTLLCGILQKKFQLSSTSVLIHVLHCSNFCGLVWIWRDFEKGRKTFGNLLT